MELGVVESAAFRSYSSPFDFSCSSESPAASSYCSTERNVGVSSSGSRLFQLSPDMLSSIWSSSENKDINAVVAVAAAETLTANSLHMDNSTKESVSSSSPPSSAGGENEEKSMPFPGTINCNGTGRESSSPLSGSTTASSSASSSLEISALELGSSLFGDSVWSSKGSFNDLGSFGSNDDEKRYLAEGPKSYLKPPGSAPGSAGWGSFWSDLSPSLSPSNSETNLQHFGSPATLPNPFSTWTAGTGNRRSAPPNSSPFSSGSVSPISRGKQLSPSNAAMGCVSPNGQQHQHHHQQQQHQQQQHYRQHQQPHSAGYSMNPNSGFNQHRQNYRRSASHPANGHLTNNGQNHYNNHNLHVPSTMGGGGGGGYNLDCAGHNGTSLYNPQPNFDNNFQSGGWNMEAASSAPYRHQDSRQYHQQQQQQQSGVASNALSGLDSMKYSLEPHLMDIMQSSANGWDDSGKGKQFFGNYPSYDGSRYGEIMGDPFDQMVSSSISPISSRMSPRIQSTGSEFGGAERIHVYSRKVFVGGLPPDIDEEEITASFRRFGPLIVDWPHKAESKSYFPPKGYAFLLFQDETSVHGLMDCSITEGDKMYFYVSSPTSKDKPVQVRPWRLNDNECYLDNQTKLDPRLTVFVGGVPRPLKAPELAVLMNQRFGYVAYAGIDVDSELKYPKGAGRVTFSNQQSYIAAINARFVQLQNNEIDKRVELKPYVLDDQICDYCHGMKCSGRSAPLFCSQVGCLAYLCEHCWTPYHSSPGKDHHKPVTKESSVDRSRPAAMRW